MVRKSPTDYHTQLGFKLLEIHYRNISISAFPPKYMARHIVNSKIPTAHQNQGKHHRLHCFQTCMWQHLCNWRKEANSIIKA